MKSAPPTIVALIWKKKKNEYPAAFKAVWEHDGEGWGLPLAAFAAMPDAVGAEPSKWR